MFRLDKVLRHKENLEKEARLERLAFERRVDEMTDGLARLQAERADLPEGDAGEAGEERIRELAAWSGYAEGIRRREISLEERLTGFRPKVDEKIRIHTGLRQEVEGLRKLRDREFSRWKKKRERKLQETIDDAASRRRLPGPGSQFRIDDSPEARRNDAETTGSPAGGEIHSDRGTGR